MKVTLNWLKEYVDFNWSPEELSERLTMLGIEVEGVDKQTGDFEGVVVAQILASDKHPNADKLSVCKVADGRGERQIVCGAKNYKVGDKVPLALPNCTLPTAAGAPPFTIKVSKMRGVESQGMLCSAKELGLADDAEGLMILPVNAQVGQPFAAHLGRSAGDVVYDLEITPNRPDLTSVVGIAREISALTGNPLRLPELKDANVSSTATEQFVAVDNQEPELCPRYVARLVQGVTIGPSPDWLRQKLEKVGIRSINNVVDITNFVLLEIGQPLHAFDYHLLDKSGAKPTIVVRRAAEGEKFTTLDGQERTLTTEMLLIADRSKGVALAGIMGGQNSEINSNTKDVLIESAYFKPQNIRATSKKLDLRSDSSYRFERGADIGICDWASRRAASLILELAGGALAAGSVDTYPAPAELKKISLRPEKTPALLGIEISLEEQTRYLASLGLKVAWEDGELVAEIPSFRVDLKREVDLIEEIARLYGVDKIPSTPPRGAIGSNAFDAVYDTLGEVRRIFSAAGLSEAQGQTLISDEAIRQLFGQAGLDNSVLLSNPLSSDMNVLRPSLLPGMLDALRHNAHHQTNDVRLFEVGRVFQKSGQSKEERRVALVIAGQRAGSFWSGSERDAKLDIYDLKGLLEVFLEQFGLRGISFSRDAQPAQLYIESASILLGKNSIGQFGQLNPILARKYDLREAVFAAELNLETLLARRNSSKSFKQLAAYPAMRRDVAMLVDENVTHEAVLNVVKQSKPANLEKTELFDVYRGKGIPEGKKSVAYAFTYRNSERTLTESETNSAHEKLIEQFKTRLPAEVRAG
ncbi:MAG: phenylalanine--tRNA ligase subunit beta [Verrucomicrobiales bacterium]